MKKLLVTLLKIALSAAILGYLVVRAIQEEGADQALETIHKSLVRPEAWALFGVAWLVAATAVLVTLVRWYYLARAVGIQFRLSDALRIGFLGYLFNLAPMGIVGGDLLKAVMLARETPGRRSKALASVLMDRVVGLYVLFLVASAGIALTGFYKPVGLEPSNALAVRIISFTTWGLAALGTLLVVVAMLPGVLEGNWTKRLSRLPRVGRLLEGLIEAGRMYRRNVRVLALSAVMSVAVHCLFACSVYLVACGLLESDVPPLGKHFVICPVGSIASTVPLPAGPMELGLVFLYMNLGAGMAIGRVDALSVALGFRLLNILIAAIGFCYYLSARREVAEVMHEAEAPAPAEEPDWDRSALGIPDTTPLAHLRESGRG